MTLQKLKKVELRKEWKNEASDFTNWLAKEENLQLLSNEIGIDISLIQTEASVGKFNVDIYAEEESTGRKVIIENQLEMTNHDHLGKIITYASGLNAKIIIWIVKDVHDEHKQAVDWLNEHTDDEVNIFAIIMELWQIGDSPYAPKFNIISKPNNWFKAIKKSRAQSDLSEYRLLQLDFWTQLNKFFESNKTLFRMRESKPNQWHDLSIGSSLAHISLLMKMNTKQITCGLSIWDNDKLFSKLYDDRKNIEAKLDAGLEWLEMEDKKTSMIRTTLEIDVGDSDNWDECFQWLFYMSHKLKEVFSGLINKRK